MSRPSSSDDQLLTRMSTGVAGLDTILSGGFMQGGIYIIQGDPGAGKTILTNQFCFHHIASVHGGLALFVTLLAESHSRMLSHMRMLSFFDESRIPDRLVYLSAFNELREEGLSGITALLRREIQRRKCSMLVIDGIVSPQTSAESSQGFREFVHNLQEIALATDCTMFMTSNVGSGSVSPEQTMVDGLIRLKDRNYGWHAESDLQVIKFRGSAYLRGRHAYKITDDGLVVHPRIEALLARPSQTEDLRDGRTSSGIAKLDALLGGGLPEASTTMIMGPSGAGKTTMGLHFLSTSCAAEPGLLFGFYETPARLRAKAEAMSKPLAALIDAGKIEIMWQPPTDDLLDAYAERLLSAIRRRGVRRLFIDGLGGFIKAAVEPGRMDHFFTTLANELRVLGVTTVYSLEVPDILGPTVRVPITDLASIAENLVLLRFIEVRSRLYRLLSILKVRNSDFDPSLHEYMISSHGMVIEENSEGAEAIMLRAGPQAVSAVVTESSTQPPAGGH